MSSFLSQLHWRFATKKFDTTKHVSEEHLKMIMEAIRFAPSSFGLQPFHVVIVSGKDLRAALAPVSFGQPQVSDSSYLFVFCARTDLPERIEEYLDVASGGNSDAKAAMKSYGDTMHGMLDGKTPEERYAYTSQQAYLALGFGLAACAELAIDACPMGGFDPAGVDAVLALPPFMKSVAYMAVGYRAEGPDRPKVRFPESDLFTMK